MQPSAMDLAQGFFGERVARHFGANLQQSCELRFDGRLSIAATRLSCARQERFRTAPAPSEPAFSILHVLGDLESLRSCTGGRVTDAGGLPSGSVAIDDLRERPQWQFTGHLDALFFYVPVRALSAVADRHGRRAPDELRCEPGKRDQILQGLSETLMRAAPSAGRNRLLTDQILLCLLTHVAHEYGGLQPFDACASGGLAPWQERRAREIMAAHLASDLSIAKLAAECRLTPSHFARAFRRSNGVAPQRYLTQLRVEEAKRHLLSAHMKLSDIALTCGFGDQSHFTRVFRQFVGVPPGAWRRARAHGDAPPRDAVARDAAEHVWRMPRAV